MFCFDGRVITGPERGSFCCTTTLIAVPTLSFLIIIEPTLMAHDAKFLGSMICGIVGFLGMIVSLTMAYCIDPGIIPRGPKHLREQHSRGPRVVEKQGENGTVFQMRRCDTCGIYRPPRCHHCRDCGNCVEVFDHHCPWVGNCIAKRNYRFFVMFLTSVSFSLAHTFAISMLIFFYGTSVDAPAYVQAILSYVHINIVVMLLMGFCAVLFLPLSCLTGYHLYIISVGETTKEDVKKMYAPGENPNDFGCIQNWRLTLCSKLPPTLLVALRDPVRAPEEGDEEGTELTPFTSTDSARMPQLADPDDFSSPVCPGIPQLGGRGPKANGEFQALAQFDEDLEMDTTMVEMSEMTPLGVAPEDMPDTDPMTMKMTDVNPLTSVDNPRAHITVEVAGTTGNPKQIESRMKKAYEELDTLQKYFSSSESHQEEIEAGSLKERVAAVWEDPDYTVSGLGDWTELEVPELWNLAGGESAEEKAQLAKREVEFTTAVLILKMEGYPLKTTTNIAFGEILLRAM